MSNETIATGVVHEVPSDMKQALTSNKKLLETWNGLTPLARNEWICWTTYVKQEDTRKDHIRRLKEDLLNGKRRPCCWMGCIHRTDKAVPPSVQGILNKRKKKEMR